MLTWIVVAAVVVVVGVLVWWTSGRAKPAVDYTTRSGKMQGEVGMRAGRHLGDQFHSGLDGHGSSS